MPGSAHMRVPTAQGLWVAAEGGSGDREPRRPVKGPGRYAGTTPPARSSCAQGHGGSRARLRSWGRCRGCWRPVVGRRSCGVRQIGIGIEGDRVVLAEIRWTSAKFDDQHLPVEERLSVVERQQLIDQLVFLRGLLSE
jgi:hypothetical protein